MKKLKTNRCGRFGML